jgi:hypothetical protein
MTGEEPQEVTEARRRVRDWESARYAEQVVTERARRDTWVQNHILRLHEVEIDAVERYGGGDHYHVQFTARLLAIEFSHEGQAGPDGEMTWDNGVKTSGAYIGSPLREPLGGD